LDLLLIENITFKYDRSLNIILVYEAVYCEYCRFVVIIAAILMLTEYQRMIRFHLHSYGEFDHVRRIGPAVWPYFDLLFIHAGHVKLRICRRKELELHSGESILIYPHTHFEGYSLADLSRASVQHFAIDDHHDSPNHPPFDGLVKLRNGFQAYPAESGWRIEADVARAMKLATVEPTPLVHEMRCALLTLILGGLSRRSNQQAIGPMTGSTSDVSFDALVGWAAQNLSRGITVHHLAQRAGLSFSHFRARFEQHYGRTAGAFLRDLRLREASRLLRETRTPIKQIAVHTGYGEAATLHHAFRKDHGITPAQYRTQFAPRG
jgi:AraC-like DNA-binding protein